MTDPASFRFREHKLVEIEMNGFRLVTIDRPTVS
jgi:hypothetical protein